MIAGALWVGIAAETAARVLGTLFGVLTLGVLYHFVRGQREGLDHQRVGASGTDVIAPLFLAM